jgi:hypothetical protein
MRRRIAVLALFAAAGLAAARQLAAQPKGGGPVILFLPAGPRALALGDAFVAGRGPEALFYNPAQIALAPGLLASAARYGNAAIHAVLATTLTLGPVTLGAGAQHLLYRIAPDAGTVTVGELGTGGPDYRDGSGLLGVAAGALRWRGIRWGVALKYVQDQTATRQDAALLDFGASREFGRFTLGAAVQHLGGGPAIGGYPERPVRVSVGAALPRTPIGTFFDVAANAGITRERDGRMTPGAGAELYYQQVEGWSFVLRAGARRPEAGPGPRTRFYKLGAGIGVDRVWVDYGFESLSNGVTVHRAGVRIQ